MPVNNKKTYEPNPEFQRQLRSAGQKEAEEPITRGSSQKTLEATSRTETTTTTATTDTTTTTATTTATIIMPVGEVEERRTSTFKGLAFAPSLEKFDPNKHDAFNFITNFEALASAQSLSVIEMMTCIRLLLLGAAMDWFNSLGEEVLGNFEKFKEKFIARYCKVPRDPQESLAQLFNIKQEQNQTVQDYVTQVQKKARMLSLDKNAVFSTLYNGFLPRIRVEIVKHAPKTIDDLISRAEITEYANSLDPASTQVSEKAMINLFKESLRDDLRQDIKHQINAMSEQITKSISSMQIAEERPQNNYVRQNQGNRSYRNDNRNQSNYQPNNAKCTRCANFHGSRPCRFRNSNCNNCRKRGHIAKACPEQQYRI